MTKKISFNSKKQTRRKRALERLKIRVSKLTDPKFSKKRDKAIEEMAILDLRLN